MPALTAPAARRTPRRSLRATALGACAALLGCADAGLQQAPAGAEAPALPLAHASATEATLTPAGGQLGVASGRLGFEAPAWPGRTHAGPLAQPRGPAPLPKPLTPRKGHTQTSLPDGCVLVAGGRAADGADPPLDFAEIYDPLSAGYSFAGQMKSARRLHGAALRSDGRVVLLGGFDGASDLSPAPEVFDPLAPLDDAFTKLAGGSVAHVVGPVVALSHDEALVFSRPADAPASKLATHAFRVDLFSGAVTLAGALLSPRRCFAAELLADGRVLVAQGEGPGGPLASAEIYDPASNAWSSLGDTPQARSGCEGSIEGPLPTLRLPSGDVLLSPLRSLGATHLYRSDSQDFVVPFSHLLNSESQLGKLPAGALALLPSGFVLHQKPSPGSIGTFARLQRFKGAPSEFFFRAEYSDIYNLAYGPAEGAPQEPAKLSLLPDGEVLVVAAPEPPKFYEDDIARSTLATMGYGLRCALYPCAQENSAAALARYDATSDVLPPLPPMPIPEPYPRLLSELSGAELAQLRATGPSALSANAYPFVFDLLSSDGHYVGSRCPQTSSYSATLVPLDDGDLLLSQAGGSSFRYAAATQGCLKLTLELGNSGRILLPLKGGQALVLGGDLAETKNRAELLEAGATSSKLLPGKSAVAHGGLYQQLSSGRVLHIEPSYNAPPQPPRVELLDPTTGHGDLLFGSSPMPRLGATSLLLPDGKVFIAGGEFTGPGSLPPVQPELFDPQTGSFSPLNPLADTQALMAMRWDPAQQRALLLVTKDAGGSGAGAHGTVYTYEPATQALSPLVAQGAPLSEGSTLSRLPDGRMLLSGDSLQTVDPKTLRRTVIAGSTPRRYPTATLLTSGRVLLAGGLGPDGKPLGSLDEFDPLTGSLTAVGQLQQPRARHTATPLPDGRLLFAGGTDGTAAIASMELYTPGQPGTEPAKQTLKRVRAGHGTALLADGRVLLAGGAPGSSAPVEFFDPATQGVSDGPVVPLTGSTSVLALPGGGALAAAQRIVQLDPQGQLSDFSPQVNNLNFSPPLALDPPLTERILVSLPGGTVIGCGGDLCYRMTPGGKTILPVLRPPLGLIQKGAGERTTLGGLLLALPPRSSETNPQFYTFTPVPPEVSRPSLAAPQAPLQVGQEATLSGERLLHRAVVGGEAATHPSAFPSIVWMPEAGGGPIFAHVTHASDTEVTFALPETVYRGAGFLHTIVTGVPSEGVFAVLQGIPAGKPCSVAMACEGGHCADGVCCDGPCDTVCRACSAERKGHGLDGVCEVLAATMAEPLCGQSAGTECGLTGTCTAQGVCASNDGATCSVTGTCLAGVCVLPKPSVCNATADAVLTASGQTKSCAPFRCEDGQCLSTCSNGQQCLPGFSCTPDAFCRRCASPFDVEIPASGSQPPSQQPCGDYACRDGACLRSCAATQDCKDGFFCSSGRCSTCSADLTQALTDGVQQPCGRLKCSQGRCPSACLRDDDCHSGWACERGECVGSCKDEHTQQQGLDEVGCKPGYRCVERACVEQCSSNRECLSGFGCVRGECSRLDEQAPASDPGACSVAGRGSAGWGLGLLGAGALAAARRRRAGRAGSLSQARHEGQRAQK